MITQNYPNTPGWKTDQTETSREAARKETSRAGTLREACYDFLKGGPATADEAAKALEESVLSIRPRFSELNTKGRIKDGGQRRKNESGHKAVVWEIV